MKNKELEEFSKELDEVFDNTDPTIKEAKRLLSEQDIEKRLKVIGWIATTLSIIGILLNAFKIVWCWPVWIASNFFWIYWATKKKVVSQVVLWVVFLLFNLFGLYAWLFIV